MSKQKEQYGWHGKMLMVDLETRKITDRHIDESIYKLFLGGRGLNMWLLYQHLNSATEPLAPENLLIFGAGPLVGTMIPSNGRYNVSSRSPLTGLLGDSNSAGYWSPPLRKIGYDGIIVSGKAESPVYLMITSEKSNLLTPPLCGAKPFPRQILSSGKNMGKSTRCWPSDRVARTWSGMQRSSTMSIARQAEAAMVP